MGVRKNAPQVWKSAVAYATLGTHRVAPRPQRDQHALKGKRVEDAKVGLHNLG